ncbi:hypothetical protein ATI61_10287 [Archangium gephyra]|uniref:Cyclic nucleotide-binding domain-containing protein n=1 Tax=Archangium gephyra TaxID=48 RepID=A0AAC8QDB9_9BACT|nr:hypothetical protein [Archangium gephyra]AKJ05016.1 Hypothetical protein AA314_06642 [Archangium gephyra]REG35719.1 hypothetical protein ATI61_10287 [Archangium gephyra]
MRPRALLFTVSLLAAPSSWAGEVSIEARGDSGRWTRAAFISPRKGEAVALRVAPRPGASIRWYRIYADLSRSYKNANHPWEPSPYAWTGWGKIPYLREELRSLRGHWEIHPLDASGKVLRGEELEPHPARAPHSVEDVGTFWFQAEVDEGGATSRSPGLELSDDRGLSPKVFRLSIREGDGYLGYLTSFFNVPGLFGSVPYQSYNYIGVDCADVLMAARARWMGKPLERDYNVAALVEELPRTARVQLRQGSPDRALPIGESIRPGDLLAVRYPGARQFQHVGAFYSDGNANGLLDADDLILHAGPEALHLSRLGEGAFDGEVAILRPERSRPRGR